MPSRHRVKRGLIAEIVAVMGMRSAWMKIDDLRDNLLFFPLGRSQSRFQISFAYWKAVTVIRIMNDFKKHFYPEIKFCRELTGREESKARKDLALNFALGVIGRGGKKSVSELLSKCGRGDFAGADEGVREVVAVTESAC